MTSAMIDVETVLEPGHHNIRISQDFSLDIEIQDKTLARTAIRTGFDAAAGKAVAESISITLSHPLIIRNVFSAIRGASRLIENPEVALFLEHLISTASRLTVGLEAAVPAATDKLESVKRFLDSAGLLVPEVADLAKKGFNKLASGFASRVGEPLSIEISSLSFGTADKAAEIPATGVLVPRFSGNLCLARGGKKAAFHSIEIPSIFLPRLNAALAGFMSGNPLAGGSIHSELVDIPDLLCDSTRLIRSIQGRIDAVGSLPLVELSLRTADRTDTVLTAWAERESVSFSGKFMVFRSGDDAVIELDELSIGASGSRKSFVCESGFTIKSVFKNGLSIPESVTGSFRQTNKGSLPVMMMKVERNNPFLKSGNALLFQIDEIKSNGTLEFEIPRSGNPNFNLPDGNAGFSAVFSIPDQCFGTAANAELSGCVKKGRVKGSVSMQDPGTIDVSASCQFPAEFRLETELKGVRELNIESGRVLLSASALAEAEIGATVSLYNQAQDGAAITPRGTVSVNIDAIKFDSPSRSISTTGPLHLKGTVRKGIISRKAAGDITLDLDWASESRQLLTVKDGLEETHDLPTRFEDGSIVVHLSPGGRLNLADSAGALIRPEIINALMSPLNQSAGLLDLLNDDQLVEGSLSRLADIISLFSRDFGQRFSVAQAWFLKVREYVRDIGIVKPADLLVEENLARLISRIISGDDSVAEDAIPLVRSINSGGGLDNRAARMMLIKHRPDIDSNYEIYWILKWIDVILTPAGLHSAPQPVKVVPLTKDPCLVPKFSDMPSGSEIYDWFNGPQIKRENVARVVELAPLMFIDQINYIISKLDNPKFKSERARLEYVVSAKKAINTSDSDSLFNVNIIPRASVLAGIVGDAIGPLPDVDVNRYDLPPPCALGPKDIADILETGLEAPYQGVQTQINNRLILEYLRQKDGDYLISVFSELSRGVSINMAIHLMAFFRQDQDRMKEPVDIEAFFEAKTGLTAPRFNDFTADGNRVQESYFDELHHLALAMNERSAVYRASKMWLREAIKPPRAKGVKIDRKRLEAAAAEARALISAADAMTSKMLAEGELDKATRNGCIKAYEKAFAACRDVLAIDPLGFKQPWFKDFWQRNEEAMRVNVCVRNHQNDCEHVRSWLAEFDPTGESKAFASKSPTTLKGEQKLVDAFIRTLWYRPADVKRLCSDPLVRLLIDPPTGDYDFTIISAMGVITDAKTGHELENAFNRLKKHRGIDLVRCPTGMMRSLEFNARAIIRTVSEVSGPWGFVGYSQGCANELRAEQIMMTGTPAHHEMIDRMVSRNLIFSAANGSVHASSGVAVIIAAMTEGEKFMKHYQGYYSREFVAIAQRAARVILDSKQVTSFIAGAWSMSLEHSADVHRNGVFLETAPTSTVRGMISAERLPDGLKYVFNNHLKLMPDLETDSQVATEDAVGHATRIKNERTAVLESCEIVSAPIHTHHWGPVYLESLALMTDEDVAHFRYCNPEDMYVFPWIDTNIRFGLIKPRSV
jgi:hypothetical protein